MIIDSIYRVVIFLVALLSLPYILYASIRYGKYRHGWNQKLLGNISVPPKSSGVKRLWLHGVSVGEINLLKPIVRELQATKPDWEFVVSSTSETGYELAKKLFGDVATVFYCPLDLKFPVKRALRRVKPDMLVLVELELWPTLIKLAHEEGVRVAIVNGRISERSFKRYLLVKRFLAPTFRRVDLVAAQDDLAAGYFRELSPCPERVLVTGSIKFDGIQTERTNPETRRFGKLANVKEDDVVFLAGSTQEPEEVGALEVYRRLSQEYPQLRLILVPRHKERFEEVAQLLDASEFSWIRRSNLSVDSTSNHEARVLLVDAVGELGAWWGLANIAFVGGSWGNRGGQNMLEPAGYGAAVSFGSNTKNFRTIVEALLAANGAVVVNNVDEATDFVRRCLQDVKYRTELGDAARNLAIRNAGATKRTLDELEKLLR